MTGVVYCLSHSYVKGHNQWFIMVRHTHRITNTEHANLNITRCISVLGYYISTSVLHCCTMRDSPLRDAPHSAVILLCTAQPDGSSHPTYALCPPLPDKSLMREKKNTKLV